MENRRATEVGERRFLVRYPSRCQAIVERDTDAMRIGIEARIADVTATGIGLSMREPLQVDETVKLQLRNEIQRFSREVRGTVRHVTLLPNPDPDSEAPGEYRVGIELITRLTPLEVSLLRMGIGSQSDGDRPRWI